jgi:NAD(P)-dependent dehydrogenase (short-subunit alcohol dehydrogenase family)
MQYQGPPRQSALKLATDWFTLNLSGGGSGLGLSLAKQLASRGVSVTVVDIAGISAAQDAIQQVAAHRALVSGLTADTTKPAEVLRRF